MALYDRLFELVQVGSITIPNGRGSCVVTKHLSGVVQAEEESVGSWARS